VTVFIIPPLIYMMILKTFDILLCGIILCSRIVINLLLTILTSLLKALGNSGAFLYVFVFLSLPNLMMYFRFSNDTYSLTAHNVTAKNV